MTLQADKMKYQKKGRVIRPHVPGWGDDQRRIHLVRRRIRQAPWWLWTLTVLILMTVAFIGGWSWPSGRNSAMAENLAAAESRLEQFEGQRAEAAAALATARAERSNTAQRVSELEAALAQAPDTTTVEELRTDLATSQQQVRELDKAIEGWAGQVEQLESQLRASESEVERLELQLQEARARATEAEAETGELETALATEIDQIPPAVAAVLRTNAVAVEAQHFVGVEWRIERRWLGDANDETHQFRNGHGTAEYRSLPTPVTAYWDDAVLVIGLGLPQMVDAHFELSATDLRPNSGFLTDLGHIFGGETDLQPLLAEADRRLNEKACGDLASLELFLEKAETTAAAAARGYDIRLRWRDGNGLYHSVVTDHMLLDSAC